VDDFLIVVPKSEPNPETGTISATDVNRIDVESEEAPYTGKKEKPKEILVDAEETLSNFLSSCILIGRSVFSAKRVGEPPTCRPDRHSTCIYKCNRMCIRPTTNPPIMQDLGHKL
jgi:hypothetical protein